MSTRVVKGTNRKSYREIHAATTWKRSRAHAERAVCIVRTETHYLQPDRNGDKTDVAFTVSGSPANVWDYLTECLPTVRLASAPIPDDAETVSVSATWSY